MNRMQTHIDRHFSRLSDSAASVVTYSRGALSVEITDAVAATTAVRMEDADGLSIRSKRRDWIVERAKLVLGGAAITPAPGDLVTAGEMIYEVQRLSGEDCYHETDDTGLRLRIHTRLIGEGE